MKLDGLFKEQKCLFAVEVFPPKRTSGVETVYKTLDATQKIGADYISVTYSAGGSGATEYTADIARYLRQKLGVEPLAHLTCLGSPRNAVDDELSRLRDAGVENILALRGDVINGRPACRDFAHASDLCAAIKARGGFYIAAACYPEGHPDSSCLADDVDRLRFKIDAGAGHFVSQLFFDNGKFFRFLNLARKKQVNCPVEAGVMPIVSITQVERTLAMSSASIPAGFAAMVRKYQNDPASFYEAGLDYAICQARDLIEAGVDGIHLYAMNRPEVAKRVYAGVKDLLY